MVPSESSTTIDNGTPPRCLWLTEEDNDDLTLSWVSETGGFPWLIYDGPPSSVPSLPVLRSGVAVGSVGTIDLTPIVINGNPITVVAGGVIKYVFYPGDSGLSGTLEAMNGQLVVNVPAGTNEYYYILYCDGNIVACGVIPEDGIIFSGTENSIYDVEVNGGIIDIPGINLTIPIPAQIYFRSTPVALAIRETFVKTAVPKTRALGDVQVTMLWNQGESSGIFWVTNGGLQQSAPGSSGSVILGVFGGPVDVVVNDAVKYELDATVGGIASLYVVGGEIIKITSVPIGVPYDVKLAPTGAVIRSGTVGADLVIFGTPGVPLADGSYYVEVNAGIINVEKLVIDSGDPEPIATLYQKAPPDYTVYIGLSFASLNEYDCPVYDETGEYYGDASIFIGSTERPVLFQTEFIQGRYIEVSFRNQLVRLGPLINPDTDAIISFNLVSERIGPTYNLAARWVGTTAVDVSVTIDSLSTYIIPAGTFTSDEVVEIGVL